jgi:hypothetical protein
MRPIRTFLVLALVPGLAGSAGAAVTAANAAQLKKHVVHGHVVSVQNAGGKTSITVLVHHHKKQGGAAAASVEKTFTVSAKTTFALVQGKKGAVQQKPADISAVQKGANVLIFHNGTEASDVKIVHKGKKKNA